MCSPFFLFRVTQLSDPSDLPKNAFSIFLLLVDHLCVEHIDYALEIGLSGTSNAVIIRTSLVKFNTPTSVHSLLLCQGAADSCCYGYHSVTQPLYFMAVIKKIESYRSYLSAEQVVPLWHFFAFYCTCG